MKNHIIKIIAFLGVLILPMAAWLIMSVAAPERVDKLDYDIGEKRDKTEIGSVEDLAVSGDEITSFFADRAPFRSVLISTYRKIHNASETPYEKGIKPVLVKLYPQGNKEERSTAAYERAYEELFRDSLKEKPAGAATGTLSVAAAAKEEPMEEETDLPVTEETEHIHRFEKGNVISPDYNNYGYTEYVCSDCGYVEKRDFVRKMIDTSYFAPNTHGEGVIVGRYDWLFLDMTGDVEYYKGTNLFSEKEEEEYLSKLRKIGQLCEDRGITLAILLAPDKEQVYSEYMPSYIVENEYKRLERFSDYVKENSDIRISYPLGEMKYADRYWRTFYKYDTHWTSVGAFIGVQSIYRMIDMETSNPADLVINERDRAELGDLFDMGEIDPGNYPADTEYTVCYKEDIPIVYESPEGVNGNVFRTAAESGNDRKLVLVGDSFRIAMAEYLEKDFAECVIAHRKSMEDISDDIRETDILVLETAERFDYLLFQSLDEMIEILSP